MISKLCIYDITFQNVHHLKLSMKKKMGWGCFLHFLGGNKAFFVPFIPYLLRCCLAWKGQQRALLRFLLGCWAGQELNCVVLEFVPLRVKKLCPQNRILVPISTPVLFKWECPPTPWEKHLSEIQKFEISTDPHACLQSGENVRTQ